MFERTEKEICDLGISGIIDISDPIFGKAISEQKQAGHYFGELSGLRRDGSIFPIYITASVFTDSQGELRTNMIIRDISKSKKMEEDLRESEVHYRILFNSIDEGFCIVEMIFDKHENPVDYRFLEVNPSFEKQTGLIDAKGRRMRELKPLHEEHWFEIYGRIALTGEPERFQKHAGQLHRWYDVYAFRYGDPKNRHVAILFNDITKHKVADEKLVKSEFLLKEAQKTAHIGSCDYDVAADKALWSDELFKIFERDPAGGEPSWIELRALIYEDDWETAYSAFQKAINEGIPYEFEFRIIKPDKNLKWAYSICEVEKDVNGNVFRLYGTVHDINERKRLEEALQKSDLLLRTILSNAPITIYATDRQGIFTLSDGNELKLAGLKPGEHVGISAFDLYNLHPVVERSGKKLTGKDVLDRTLAGEKITVTYELNGVLFESHISPLLNEDGKVMGIVGVSTNITERKLAEDNFLEVEGRYRLLSEQSGIGIGLYSPRGEILYYNIQALSNLGCKTEEYTGKLLTEVYGEQKGNEYLKRIRKAIRTGKSYDYEDFLQTPSGSYWFLSNHMRVCNSKGKVIGVQVLAHDITQIKRTEEKLKQSTEEYRTLVQHIEEEMENERTQIARDLHDDLGQKLTILSMDISWLKSRLGVKSQSVDKKLNEMGHLLTETIESIKKISFGLRPSILDDLGIRAAIKWQLSDFSKTTGITCSLVILPKDLAIDKTLSTVIFRIIQESLTNIARHSEAKKVSVILNSGEGSLKLMIRDNGKGIEPVQINDPKSFGLIGIRERARSHGGEVSISGKKGVGTLVLVVIPVGNRK